MRMGIARGSRLELPGLLSHPLALGTFVVLLIAASILLAGEELIESNVLGAAGQEQADDLDRFSAVLHLSGLGLNGTGTLERMPDLAGSASFDNAVRRALFGVHAQRLDVFSLNGASIYSTAGDEISLDGEASAAFQDALAGRATTLYIPPSSSSALLGVKADALQTFRVIRSASPDSRQAGEPLMVAALSTDVSGRIDQAYNTILLVVAVFTVGSMLIIGLVHWASVRSRARLEVANRHLADQYEEVRKSRERMVLSADATKRAIAEELHGTVQTKLFASWMKLQQVREKIEDAETGAELDRLIDEIDAIREDDIRGLSHRLHPSIVRVGALPALRSLGTFYSGMVEVSLDVNAEATALEPPGTSCIPEPIRLAVYRIAELALGNVVKHSGATHCEVGWRFEPTERRLILSVRDDGRGFDPALAPSGGLGMVNISDYADSLGGSVEVDSKPDGGTCVTLTVPFMVESADGGQAEKSGAYVPRGVASRPQAA
jgi:signal transduction histidine kinase